MCIRDRPRILGALLGAVGIGLLNIEHVQIDELPRMADFAKWVTACEPGLLWGEGEFMEAYTGNRAEAIELALETDPVAVAVKAMLEEEGKEVWEGTATDLLSTLEMYVPEATRKTKAWPKTAKTLGNRLRRAATFLRQTGTDVEFYRLDTAARTRLIRISKEN